MAVETITETILRRAEAEAASILAESRRRIDAERAAAMSRAEAERAKARDAAQAPCARRCAALLHEARLEAVRIRSEVTRSLVQEAVGRARLALAQTRRRDDYPSLLGRMLAEAADELQGPAADGLPPHIEADERDRPLLERALVDLGAPAYVDYRAQCWGGVRGRSADGRVTVDNTLEARLDTALPVVERQLAAAFEAGDAGAAIARLSGDEVHLAFVGAHA